jgi:succinoglycan biosynthesis transport protein ExoP
MFGPPKMPVTIEPPAAPVSPMGTAGPGFSDGDVHLLDRVSVLYRYRKIVLTVVVLVLIAGAVQTYTTTPEYSTRSQVEVRPDRSPSGGVQTAFDGSDDMQTQTELQNMQTRSLLKRVLQHHPDIANHPELNGRDSNSSGLASALASVRTRLMGPVKSLLGSAPPAKPLVESPIPAGMRNVSPAASIEPETPEEARRIDALKLRLVVRAEPNSRLYDITIESSDPVFAALAANAIAQEYVAQNGEIKEGNLRTAVEKGKLELDAAKAERDARQHDMLEAQQKPEGRDFLNMALVSQRLDQFRSELDDAKLKVQASEDTYKRLTAYRIDDPNTNVEKCGILNEPEVHSDPNVTSALAQLRVERVERNRLTEVNHLGPVHPSVVAVDAQIRDSLTELKTQTLNIIEVWNKGLALAKGAEAAKQERYNTYTENSNRNASEGLTYAYLEQLYQQKVAEVTSKQSSLDQTQQQLNSVDNNARVQDTAMTPLSPFKPKASQNMLIALAFGLGLAAMISFVLDYLDDTIKTPEDITRKLHLPFLGLVPSVHGDRVPVLSGPVPHDFGEAYRALRTSLVFTSGGESTRVITVTSAQPLEGKTTTACNLAMVLAFGGSRVLLIDADMRRPGVHKALKINNTVGLSHLLVGQARVREAIQRTSDPNFCVMTAGRTPPNPSELLASERMKQLVANLKQGPFDWVVMDTPPVLAVTDAIIVTPLADCALFVLGAEMTRRRLAERAVNMLLSCRPKVVGAVLNRVNFDRNKYYYSRYYGYQYKSYYGTNAGVTSSTAKK